MYGIDQVQSVTNIPVYDETGTVLLYTQYTIVAKVINPVDHAEESK